MAISSYPTPAEAGLLCVIIANTAISISIVKHLFRSFLHVIGIHVAPSEELPVDPSSECRMNPSESYVDEFRAQMRAVRYESVSIRNDSHECCSICLTVFKQNAEVNSLCCGHVFHKPCLEKWLNYWHTTCPLCRNRMMIPRGEKAEREARPM